jgi:hypothetical protein
MAFDPDAYAPAIAELLREPRLPALGPGTPDLAFRARLAELADSSFAPHRVVNRSMAEAGRAGLWLLFDFLDESHGISQGLHTAEGSYWHAIMHRREPDPDNSKYWWHRVGNHPVFAQLADEAARLGWRVWDPSAFVDACEKERGSGSEREALLREVQRVEWDLLFDYCYRHATGA